MDLTSASEDELVAELTKRRSPPCLWCGQPAVAFCDEWIGGGVRDGFFVLDVPHILCSAPMCVEHGKKIGHVCFRSGDADTIDRCPYHAEQDVGLRHHPDTIPKTEKEAEAVRRLVAADARRSRFRPVQ